MRRRKLPRPRMQRAFTAWMEEPTTRLAVPVQLGRLTDACWEMTFGDGVTSALQPRLQNSGIEVMVWWQETFWDLVLSLDVAPERVADGYISLFVLPEYRIPFATREELWRAEVFEPFAEWVNDVLAPAHALGLWRLGGMTWAKLLAKEDMERPDVPEAYTILPIRENLDASTES